MNLLNKQVKPVEGKVILSSIFSFYKKDLVYGSLLGVGIGLVGVTNGESDKIQAVVDGLSSSKIFDFIGLLALILCLVCLWLCDVLDQEEKQYEFLACLIDFTDWCSRKTIDLYVVFFSSAVPYFLYVFYESNELKHKILMPFITVWGVLFMGLLAGAFFILSSPKVRSEFIAEVSPILRFPMYYLLMLWFLWVFVDAFFV